MSNPRACPFCGIDKTHTSSNGCESFFVVCENCGAEGTAKETECEAVSAWSSRGYGSSEIASRLAQRLRQTEAALKAEQKVAEKSETDAFLYAHELVSLRVRVKEMLEVMRYFRPFVESEQDDERQAPWVERYLACLKVE